MMGLLTPTKICYTYVIRVMMGNTQSYIQEHLPLVVIKQPLFLVLILLWLLILIFSKTKIKIQELFMVFGLILLSLISARHLTFFYSICLFYIALIINRFFNDKKDKTFYIFDSIIIKSKIIVFCLTLLVLVCSYSRFNYNYGKSYVDIKEYPVGAVKYIKNNLNINNLRIYNDYNVGSYLLFNDIPVFIDSRCDLYLKEFNGKFSIDNDYINIDTKYNIIFNNYDISYVLINKNDLLYYFMCLDNKSEEIYSDKYFALFKYS